MENNLKGTCESEILTKDFFRKMTSPELAHYLGKYIWGPMITGSVKSDIVEEAVKRLKEEAA